MKPEDTAALKSLFSSHQSGGAEKAYRDHLAKVAATLFLENYERLIYVRARDGTVLLRLWEATKVASELFSSGNLANDVAEAIVQTCKARGCLIAATPMTLA